jgi:dinuclear metal center YbgI/SA1388 family protein
MPLTVRDMLDLLEEIAPAHLAEPWDNPGLQVGSYSQVVTRIFFALDPTSNALRRASKCRAQLLLTHHPLIFRPFTQLDITSYPGNVIVEAIKSGISVASAHTNLDVARGGINDILSELLDLQNVEVLKEVGEGDGTGLGRIGDLPEPSLLSGVERSVKGLFGAEKLKVVGDGDPQIRRVVVVGGSGGGLVTLASQKGADLLLTGDVSHHHALEARSLGIALIDTGHFHAEKKAFGIFARRVDGMLVARGWQVRVEVDDEEANPMREGE